MWQLEPTVSDELFQRWYPFAGLNMQSFKSWLVDLEAFLKNSIPNE